MAVGNPLEPFDHVGKGTYGAAVKYSNPNQGNFWCYTPAVRTDSASDVCAVT